MEVSCRFRRGCNVEVRSEDKDSKGAWYPATILEPPANQRKRSKVLVQYNTMLDEEDPTKLLVEHTTLPLIRPKPPADNAETRFERNDVVDAFHNDMWWPGLVINIVGDKYTVGFKEPPDLLELGRNVLRSHWDWADGVWTRAPKEVMKVSDWKPATQVEVNLNRFELRSSWLPAILLVQLGDNSFLVRYRYKTTDNDSEYDVKAVVSKHQIRPRPPQQEDKTFGLRDMVDAYFDMGWWVSDVTKVLVKKKKYMVKFRITGEEKEFSHSELRCHLEWIGKQWKKFQDCQDNKDDGRRLKQSRKRSNYYAENTKFRGKQLSPCIKKLSLQHNGDPTFSSPNPSKKLKAGSSKDSSLARIYKRKTPVKTSNGDDKKIEQQHNRQLDSQAISDGEWNTYKRKRFREPKSQEINQHDDDVLRHGIKAKRKLPEIFVEHPEGPTTGYPAGTTNHQVAGLSATAKTGFNEIPLSLCIVGMHSEKSSDFPTRDGKGKASSVEVQVDGTGVSAMAPSQDQSFSSCIDGMDSENTMKGSSDPDGICNEQNLVAEAGIVTMLPVHDQPLTLCIVNDQPPLPLSIVNDHPLPLGIVNSGNTIEGSSNSAGTAKKQCEVRGGQVENGFTVDTEREETPRLPFVQTSHFWKIFESMDEFKRYPQQPHFKPLQNLKMIKREANALQCMHLFSSMVKCTSKLQVNDPSGCTDEILETLAELEQQGFKVKALENHLNQFKGMQLRFEDLQNQSNVVEMQINKYGHEITEQDMEISDLKEQVKELKEQVKDAILVREVKCSEVNYLQSKANTIAEGIQSARHDLNSFVAAEW